MKRLVIEFSLVTFILFGFIVGFLFPALPASFLIYNSDTKEVYSLSPQDDAVMPAKGYTKEVLKDDYKDIQLQYPADKYFYKNKKFIANTKKISDEELAIEQIKKQQADEILIQQKMRETAIAALKAEGKLSAEVK